MSLQRLCLLLLTLVGLSGSAQGVVANIDVRQTGTPITKYHFGQFIENLGNVDVGDLIEDGLWAEMLDDRKFFYPVDTIAQLTPVNKRDRMQQWTPIGRPDAVKMDLVNPYVGIHSPTVFTSPATSAGIVQSGLALQTGKRYVGRIALRGNPTVSVTVRLEWGTQPSQQVTVVLPKLRGTYQTYPLAFVSGGRSGNARLVQLGRLPVTVTGNAPQPTPKWPIGGEQPRVNAGGDTYPLDIIAALTPDRKALTVAVVNPTETAQPLTLQLTGATSTGTLTKWTLTGTGVNARNIVGQPAEAFLRQTTLPM